MSNYSIAEYITTVITKMMKKKKKQPKQNDPKPQLISQITRYFQTKPKPQEKQNK